MSEHILSQLGENLEPFRDKKPGRMEKLRVSKINGDVGHDRIIPCGLLGWDRCLIIIAAPILEAYVVCYRTSGENTWSPQSSGNPSAGLF